MLQLMLQSTSHCKVNWTEVLTIRSAVFRVDKTPIRESAGKQLRDVNVARSDCNPEPF